MFDKFFKWFNSETFFAHEEKNNSKEDSMEEEDNLSSLVPVLQNEQLNVRPTENENKQKAQEANEPSCVPAIETNIQLHQLNLPAFVLENPNQEAIVTTKASEMISWRLPVFCIAEEYSNQVMKRHIFNLIENNNVNHAVRVRGDGNCFYRSFGLALLSYLLVAKRSSNQSLTRVLFGSIKIQLKVQKYLPVHLKQQFLEQMEICYKHLLEYDKIGSELELFTLMREENFSNSVVFLIRVLAALTLFKDENNDYSSILCFVGYNSVEKYVLERVLTMGEDAEELEISAATKTVCHNRIVERTLLYKPLPLQLKIIKLERDERELTAVVYDLHSKVTQSTTGKKKAQNLSLFYRPGHYDVLL